MQDTMSHETHNSAEALKSTSPESVIGYLRNHWDTDVRVLQAPEDSVLTVEEGWHGQGKTGEVEVLFGKSLLEPISGTHLSADVFASWLGHHGFEFKSGNAKVSSGEAASYLSSEKFSKDDYPVFEAIRKDGPPVVIQIFNGSTSYPMQFLTDIGNDSARTTFHDNTYRGTVMELMAPFIVKGTTAIRRTGNFPEKFTKISPIDDCLAGCTTVAGDIEYRHSIGALSHVVYDMKFSVVTTQGLSVALFLSEKYNIPMIIRGGAASFGLAGADLGTNYMLNTQEEMIYFRKGQKDEIVRKFTSGDFGNIMSDGTEKNITSYKESHGNGTPERNTVFYLNGGWPIRQIWKEMHLHNNKPIHGNEYVVHASRIDNSPITGKPTDWGVIFKGIREPVKL
jgi:hypothetical protein